MADKLEQHPVFTIVMGCSGAGKTAWKRHNYSVLPAWFFDPDSFAGGIGDWNSADAHRRTWEHFDAEISAAILARVSFGIERTYAGRRDLDIVARLRAADYRIEGIYIGTASPEINVERIERRVLRNTGHRVDPALVPARYRDSLSNLSRTVEWFDQLNLLDNSRDDPPANLRPVEQCRLERGEVVSRLESGDMAEWCAGWLAGVERSLADRREAQ